jgi:cobalt-zinc-cadmium efflux system protein
MAHRRKPLRLALALNTAVLAVEVGAGLGTNSLSLVIDGVHNLSDELGIALLFLAYTLPSGLSAALLRSANFFNSIGLLAISGYLAWRSVERLATPVPVIGLGPVMAGLLGVVGNWGVARALRRAAARDAAIRLAYVHNLGDVLLSIAPVAAGLLVLGSGRSLFDPLIALGLAGAIVVTTVRELWRGGEALLWPPTLVCGHRDGEGDGPGVAGSRGLTAAAGSGSVP